jgi:hypothetical protein
MSEPSASDARKNGIDAVRPSRRRILQVAAATAFAGVAGILGSGTASASDCTNACARWVVGCLNWCRANDNTDSCIDACNSNLGECLQCCNNGGSNCVPPPAPNEYFNPVFIPALILLPGFEVISRTRKAQFRMQGDGNLVVYDERNRARWASNTVGRGAYALFQQDGNLVVYNGGDGAAWASNTCCWTNNYLSVQDDGNVVVYTSFGFPLWATGTNH